MLIVMGVVLGIADRVGRTDRTVERLDAADAVLFGAAQALALVPGVSRSGATIPWAASSATTARPPPASRSSSRSPRSSAPGCWSSRTGPRTAATPTAGADHRRARGVVRRRYAAIAWLLRYVTTHSFTPFVIYRIALGVLTLVLLGAGVLRPSAGYSQPDRLKNTNSAPEQPAISASANG